MGPKMGLVVLATGWGLAVHARSYLPNYPQDLFLWKAVAKKMATAGLSEYEWRVFQKNGHVKARLTGEAPRTRPPFVSKDANVFCQKVEDGWLVGTNRGEWGGRLDWYSPDGRRKVHVSEHQVVGFFRRRDGLYALEGLTHFFVSRGSLVRLQRSAATRRWTAKKAVRLPAAPDAVSLRRDGTAVIVLSDRVVAFTPERKVRTLFEPDYKRTLPSHAETSEYSDRLVVWSGHYPNSCVLSHDETKLYIGMRRFVGEVDLVKKRFRALIPSNAFLNRTSPSY